MSLTDDPSDPRPRAGQIIDDVRSHTSMTVAQLDAMREEVMALGLRVPIANDGESLHAVGAADPLPLASLGDIQTSPAPPRYHVRITMDMDRLPEVLLRLDAMRAEIVQLVRGPSGAFGTSVWETEMDRWDLEVMWG